MVYNVAEEDQKCVLALHHSVLYKPTKIVLTQFCDRQEGSAKTSELEGCDPPF